MKKNLKEKIQIHEWRKSETILEKLLETKDI